ncbi:outer membrane beta-barrel family protein [Dyadobacter sp. CY312]|uniref:outer membrane beta-barrel family protein n=1 Tax=Dyadobacter sp. CY312 TaxID=2907303 RepID=UPI001F42153F|nr:outer membrane beta-barrel family protein [Dyadobacter sp. CY312]MCE7043301.1 TonB-dependent receptor [Dyadobacter sp. CY312]
MRYYYRILFFCTAFLCLCTFSKLRAQQVNPFLVKGIIADSATRKNIEFATISILDNEKKVVALTYSDENGLFKSADISEGSYFLNLSFVGYGQKNLPFNVSQEKAIFDFGKIFLNPDVNELKTVTITGSRQLVEQQPGMLIYNAEKDISNNGGTAADVLRKAPILNVDAAGNVTMRGNSNLRILINGKYSGQMARSPGDALNMMPAGSIKSVEVITSPSARYDAEGAAGVINIITKKGQKSVSGTLELVGGNLEQAINPRLSINRDKWNINSTLHIHRFRDKELTSLERTSFGNGMPTGRLLQETTSDNTNPHSSGDVQIEFTPDSLNLFNFSVNGWLGRWPENSEQLNRLYSPSGALLDEYRQSATTTAPSKGFDLNLGYTRKFKKPGEELYLMAQHNRSTDDFNYNSLQTNREQIPVYRELNDNRTENNEWTFQADYILPLAESGRHALESGLKAILRSGGTSYDVRESSSNQPDVVVPVPARSDIFDFSQDVLAAYTQIKLKWNSGWAVHAGARVEGTFLEGKQRIAGTTFKNDFWNFVPSATLFKKLNANNNLTLSYTKRISRPSLWDLNPNTNSQDPNNISVGNPDLRPEEVNQAEFTYALQTDKDLFLNFSLFGRKTNNSIENIARIVENGAVISTMQNLASNAQYGVNFSTSFAMLPNWKVNSNANVRHAQFRSGALNISNEGMAWGINVNSSWKLRNNYSVQLYGDYDAKSITLQGYESSWFYYSFSAKKEIPSKKLTISLTTVSPFGSYLSRNEIVRSTDFDSTFRNRRLMRSVRLSLNWEFGGLIKSSNSRKISNDDQKNVKSGG